MAYEHHLLEAAADYARQRDQQVEELIRENQELRGRILYKDSLLKRIRDAFQCALGVADQGQAQPNYDCCSSQPPKQYATRPPSMGGVS